MQGSNTEGTPAVPEFVIGSAPAPAVEPFDWDIFHFQLNQAAERFEARLQASADELVTQRLQPPVHAFRKEFESLTRDLLASGRALHVAQQKLSHDLRLLAWKTIAIALGAASLVVAGSTWVAFENTRIARESRLDAETSRLLRGIQIGSCGRRACVKLDGSAPRWGKDRNYVLLDAQPAKDAKP